MREFDSSAGDPGAGPFEKPEERGTLAGIGANRKAKRNARNGGKNDGEGVAGMRKRRRHFVGGIDFHGGAAAAKNQIRRRAETVRTRSARAVGGVEAVLDGREEGEGARMVSAVFEVGSGFRRRLGVFLQI